jgi:hypothetical protein
VRGSRGARHKGLLMPLNVIIGSQMIAPVRSSQPVHSSRTVSEGQLNLNKPTFVSCIRRRKTGLPPHFSPMSKNRESFFRNNPIHLILQHSCTASSLLPPAIGCRLKHSGYPNAPSLVRPHARPPGLGHPGIASGVLPTSSWRFLKSIQNCLLGWLSNNCLIQ